MSILSFFKKSTLKPQSLTDTDMKAILVSVHDTPENIMQFIYDKQSVLKFSVRQIGLLAVNSQKHCEFLLAMEIMKKHPDYLKIKAQLDSIEQSFQMQQFYKAPK